MHPGPFWPGLFGPPRPLLRLCSLWLSGLLRARAGPAKTLAGDTPCFADLFSYGTAALPHVLFFCANPPIFPKNLTNKAVLLKNRRAAFVCPVFAHPACFAHFLTSGFLVGFPQEKRAVPGPPKKRTGAVRQKAPGTGALLPQRQGAPALPAAADQKENLP